MTAPRQVRKAKTPRVTAQHKVRADAPQLIVDLDGTLTQNDATQDYAHKPLNTQVAAALHAAVAQGYGVQVFTARNMRTYAGDMDKIMRHTYPVAKAWLEQHHVPHDALMMGKPWCCEGGFYVDDRALHPEELVFKFLGPWAGQTVDVVIPFYNEEKNLAHTHALQLRLERLLNIGKFIYVNNGSKDGTGAGLEALAAQNPQVKVVHVQVNQGYGFGMKSGIAAATADWVMTNHADGQFDPYTFLLTHARYWAQLPQGEAFAVVPRRLNRPWNWAARTALLRGLASVLAGQKLGEFNGQPKMWRRTVLMEQIADLPNDFCLDLAVYLALKQARQKLVDVPVLEQARYQGVSSWAGQWRRTLRLAGRYLEYAWSQRER